MPAQFSKGACVTLVFHARNADAGSLDAYNLFFIRILQSERKDVKTMLYSMLSNAPQCNEVQRKAEESIKNSNLWRSIALGRA